MKQYYIYLTTNQINGMKYIGKHYGELDDSYLGSGVLLRKEIDRLGKENFTKSILFVSKDEKENCKKEQEYITLYNAVYNPLFYNIHVGGQGGDTTAGYSLEEKENLKQKLSIARMGEKNGMYGKHHSEQTKHFLSYWATFERDNSIYRTEGFKTKMSQVTTGEKNGMYGKHHTELSKQKMSMNSIGKTLGEKNGMYGKSENEAINGKHIGMYDKNWQLIKTFNAKTAVLQFLNLKGHTQLDRAIKEKNIYKGYYWKQINKDESVETKIEG